MASKELQHLPAVTTEQCAAGVKRHAKKSLVSLLKAGLWLMKARALHALPPSDRSQGRKSVAPGAIDSAASQEAGFAVWFANQEFGFSYRTAREWMQGCAGLGLTAASEESEIDAPEIAARLEGKKWKEILALPETKDGEGDGENKEVELVPKVTPEIAARDLVMPWFKDVVKVAAKGSPEEKALYKMSELDFKKAGRYLRTAMDTMTAVGKERGVTW